MSERITIGIDPGPAESAYVVWNGKGCLVSGDMPNGRLALHLAFVEGVVACEWVESFGMAVGQAVFQTVFTIGQLCAAVPSMRLIPRRDVKLHICGQSRAKDANIRQALIDRFGEPGTKRNPGPLYGISKHRWAALAIAVTAWDLARTDHEADFHTKGVA